MLSVALFGSPKFSYEGGTSIEAPGLVGELLAFLLVHPGDRVTRDQIGDALWPDGEPRRNRRRLSNTLWRLRQLLGHDLERWYLDAASGRFLGFNRSAEYTCDVEELERSVRDVNTRGVPEGTSAQRSRLRAAVELYRGEFLEGVMSEWVLPHRDRLCRAYEDCLVRLMRASAADGDLDESVYWAELILEQDPFREDVHRMLIETYDQSGRRTDAVRHFDRMRHLLEEELHTQPSPETISLYYRVLDDARSEPATVEPLADADPAGQAPSTDAELALVLKHLADVERLLADGLNILARSLGVSLRLTQRCLTGPPCEIPP